MFLPDLIRKDRVRDDFNLRHNTVEFEKTARHVVPGRNQTQAAKALLPHPLRGLTRVPKGILGVVAECHAASGPIRSVPRNPQQLIKIDLPIDPRDKELAPFSLTQQLDAALEAQTAAGQHDDGISRRRPILG